MIIHKHHIIPRHAGGTDNTDNIILLSLEEHIEAHRLRYEQYGNDYDRLAWLALSGQMGKEEIIQLRNSIAHKGQIPWNKGISHSEESKEKMRKRALGRKVSDDTKQKMSLARKGKR